jgi:hypothetical protein
VTTIYDFMLSEWSDATGGDKLDLEAWADLRKCLLMEECEEVHDDGKILKGPGYHEPGLSYVQIPS